MVTHALEKQNGEIIFYSDIRSSEMLLRLKVRLFVD